MWLRCFVLPYVLVVFCRGDLWGKGWELDDKYWRAVNTMNKENDRLASTMSGARYMVWWQLSDYDADMMKICECGAKIICHTSLLKVDDYRLKDQPPSSKTCELCDLYAVENIFHLLMQCPGMYDEQEAMYDHIYRNAPEIRKIFTDEPIFVFFWLLGRNIPDINEKHHIAPRRIAGRWIYRIYHKAVHNRSGVG